MNHHLYSTSNFAYTEKKLQRSDEMSKKKKRQTTAELVAYTDGSYNKNAKLIGASSVIIFQKQHQKPYILLEQLSNKHFVNYNQIPGELQGVLNAIEFAIKNHYHSIEVRFDFSGIKDCLQPNHSSECTAYRHFREVMGKFKNQIKIDLVQVKAHQNIEFNTLADRFAKLICNNTQTFPNHESIVFDRIERLPNNYMYIKKHQFAYHKRKWLFKPTGKNARQHPVATSISDETTGSCSLLIRPISRVNIITQMIESVCAHRYRTKSR